MHAEAFPAGKHPDCAERYEDAPAMASNASFAKVAALAGDPARRRCMR
jgi:hypothetical protein